MEQQYNIRSPAVKRLMREAKELSDATPEYFAQPLADNLFEWHFTVRGPADSDFDGGVYHGRILLPPDYPMKPPNIIILTPNGRFETGKKICLSISGHHPESWQPSWSIRTALLAIIGFMPTPGHGTIGAVEYSPEERRRLAKKSVSFACDQCGIVAELLKPSEADSSTSDEAKEIIKSMSLKGEDESQQSNSGQVESEAERKRRERKEASRRAQQRFRERIIGRTPDFVAEIANKQARAQQSARADRAADLPHPVPERESVAPRQRATHGHQFSAYDLLIALVVIAIAAIVYRRFNGHES